MASSAAWVSTGLLGELGSPVGAVEPPLGLGVGSVVIGAVALALGWLVDVVFDAPSPALAPLELPVLEVGAALLELLELLELMLGRLGVVVRVVEVALVAVLVAEALGAEALGAEVRVVG